MRIPSTIPLDKEGQYCIKCFSGPIKRISKNNLTYYECLKCGEVSERSLVIDNRIVWRVDAQGNYWHESVGVVVVNKKGKILSMLRKIYPFAYAIPSGHLDAGEKPEAGAIRELKEETGLSVGAEKLQRVGEFYLLGDSCRRGSDHHQWHLYRIDLKKNFAPQLSDEASEIDWLSLKEIKKIKNVTYPLQYIADKFAEFFK